MTVSQPGKPATYRVTVTGTERLTPNMRRMTFEGEALKTLSVPLPAQWLKVILPGVEGKAGANRAYTIRRFYQGWGAMEVDFVLHGDIGPASAWAERAEVGDVVHLGSPRGGHRIDPDARWRLLAGDETALPAIASILDAVPDGDVETRVIIEVPSPDDAQPLRRSATTEIHWLAREEQRRRPGSLLVDRISGLRLPVTTGQVFLAGEGNAVRTMNQDLARSVSPASIEAKGYWLLGQADHRDRS